MDSDDLYDFTDEEIREELSKLGYNNVPESRLCDFKTDLQRLVRHEKSISSSQNTSLSSKHNSEESTGNGPILIERVPRQQYQSNLGLGQPSKTKISENGIENGENRYFHLSPARTGKENKLHFSDTGHRLITKKTLQPRMFGDDYFSMYDSTPDTSQLHLRDDCSETDSERRLVKRKVLRKKQDGSRIIDESFTESETGSIADMQEQLKQLGILDSIDMFDQKRPQSAQEEPPYRLSPDDPRPASVILRPADHPHTRYLKKSDPVARHHQFRQMWHQQKAPGENNRKNLRWNVREQMLVQDQIIEKKAQKSYMPNNYVVPTDKKRKNLRWRIRMNLAQGDMPEHGFYHDY